MKRDAKAQFARRQRLLRREALADVADRRHADGPTVILSAAGAYLDRDDRPVFPQGQVLVHALVAGLAPPLYQITRLRRDDLLDG